MADVALDPIIAALAASLEMKGAMATLPDAAVAVARAKLRSAPASEKKRLATDLIAWAIKLNRLAGANALRARIVCAELALELLADEAATADMFRSAGLGKEVDEAIGRSREVRAPKAEPVKGPAPVKASRGLKKS